MSSGAPTIGGLTRLDEYLAGQQKWDVDITGGEISNVTLTDVTITLATPLIGASGGTGVANTGKTITLGGNINTAGAFTTAGAFATTLTATAATNVTLPTTGTLSTLAGAETLTNKTLSGTGSATLANASTMPVILTGGASPTAGNLYGLAIQKTGSEELFLGINKNSTTGSVPSNALYLSTYTATGQIAIGRGNGAGLPNTADLLINGSGQLFVNGNQLTVAATASVSGTNTGDVTLSGENYLSRSGQVITANAVNLSGTNVTGTLAAARMPALTGDVTTSAGAVATTIANNAVTYAKIQDVSATSRILGRKTAGAGDTEECTLSEVLDFVGSPAQGDILYRGASGWTRLGAGTSGQFLKTQGAGANPLWADASSKVVQQVYSELTTYTTCTTALPYDDTIPQNTEGDEILSRSITPTNASNLLLIEIVVPIGYNSAGRTGIALFQDSTANALAAQSATPQNTSCMTNIVIRYRMTAGTTSATTFKVRAGDNSGNAYINGNSSGRIYGGVSRATITVTEIAA